MRTYHFMFFFIYLSVFYLTFIANTLVGYAADNDRVLVRQAGTVQSVTGSITSITGIHGVTLSAKGKTLHFPMTQVLAVETHKTDQHEKADLLFSLADDSGDPAQIREALSLYKQARGNQELPLWLRQWLTVRIVDCLKKLDDNSQAAQQFFLLCHIDPYTPFLNHIPLVWSVRSNIAQQQSRAAIADLTRQWLSPSDNPTKNVNPTGHLLAASMMLDYPGPERNAAVRMLEDLVTCTSPDDNAPNLKESCRVIALLAMAQLWRLKLLSGTLSEKELAECHDIMQKLPVPLQAGPLLLIVEGYSKLGKKEKANECLLQFEILY